MLRRSFLQLLGLAPVAVAVPAVVAAKTAQPAVQQSFDYGGNLKGPATVRVRFVAEDPIAIGVAEGDEITVLGVDMGYGKDVTVVSRHVCLEGRWKVVSVHEHA